ncbi:hypothetical protein L6164_010590 [Bauhinia variegata]|uniref:Uncharacterized protein n=1 Tax=Bauhinia variegata TaxID=167791 RepID=A0ACB9PMR5_BAUVA|nr:hypothetical protein L6164_010590 [Bauhinia variegata]
MRSSSVVEAERDKYSMINFEETELRLGWPRPSANVDSDSVFNNTGTAHAKRGFSETTTSAAASVDLKLNLSSASDLTTSSSAHPQDTAATATATATATAPQANDPAKPPAAKAQVVGWPPVRSFRKNIVSAQKNNNRSEKGSKSKSSSVAFVKVSMDGAPYLRKVDLKLYKSYQELSDGLAKMFSSFTINAKCGSDFLNERKLIDLLNGSDYVPTYQDKDGDWMLVGDVPWEMFVESCQRLRIMKGSEAIGLAPRAVEKCKNRS